MVTRVGLGAVVLEVNGGCVVEVYAGSRESLERGEVKMGFYQRLLLTSSKSITECNF